MMSSSTKNQDEKKKGSLFQTFLLTVFVGLILLNLPVPCQTHSHDHDHHHHDHDHDHDHDHGHSHEPPSFKYSKQANEHLEEKQSHDHAHVHHEHHEDEKPYWRPLYDYLDHQGDVFVQAMGSTLLISAAPFAILFLVPLDNTKEHESLLKILLSFASGGLLGDAFLHLIPHALPHHHGHSHDHHEHSHDHDHHHHGHSHDHKDGEGHHHEPHDMSVGLCVLGGIITFLLVEKIIRIIKGDHHHDHHHPSPSPAPPSNNEDAKDNDDQDENEKPVNDNNVQDENEQLASDNNEQEENVQPVNDIRIAGYLNLAADFLHNFTDGLAIGASYLAGTSVGYVTTFTILLHEVPHEIGDFAILIRSGCSKPKAIMLQLVTAVGALLGTYISLLVGGMGDIATRWILPFTAGGFIYIATVSVIPELLVGSKFWQSIKEIIALLVGVYMMVLVAEYE